MISVKLPDGSTAQFPDGTPKEVMQAAIAKKFPPTAPAAPMDAAGFQQHLASGDVSQNIERAPQPAPERPNLLNSTLATVNGISASIPGLQPLTDAIGGGISQITGGNFNDYIAHQKKVREDIAKSAPIARVLGELGGSVATMGGLAKMAGTEAVGLSGSFGKRLLNSALSNQGVYTAGQLAEGKRGTEALGNGIPALAGAVGTGIGSALSKGGQTIANALTSAAQRKLTTAAIERGAQTAGELKSAASQMFESATGGQPLMVSDNAYFRLLGDVKQVADKFRINADNDQKSVGLLSTLMRIADDTATGTKVDMKDLHLIRQLAAKVAQSSEGRDKAFGSMVVGKLDGFIKTLKPGDILGGANPRDAANQLMNGIYTWSKASKVGLIEEAIAKADTYKSGLANGLKLSFLNLMRSDDFRLFSEAEKAAIRDVAKGVTKQNIAELLGKLGFSFGGSAAHNIVGGSLGTGGLAALLSPLLGPLSPAAVPLALGATTAVGSAGRAAAESIAKANASRAAQAVAVGGIPAALQRPNLLAPAGVGLDLLTRAAGQ